jgi:hypothetical protein
MIVRLVDIGEIVPYHWLLVFPTLPVSPEHPFLKASSVFHNI